MLNPDLELNRLRWKLQNKGWLPQELDEICDLAASEINSLVLEIVSNATAEAIDYAQSIGATEFLDDMDIVESGHIFQIRTRSGVTDYSRERREMLPHLLKNAKTAKDGSRYKIIPIKKDEKAVVGSSMFDTQKDIQRAQKEARSALITEARNNRSARANVMTDQFRQAIRRTMSDRNAPLDGAPEGFRTASSKQDPENSWVRPERDADMTQFLVNLNDRIRDTIEQVTLFIIKLYEQEYS